MKTWTTEIIAIDPLDNTFKRWSGQRAYGNTIQEADMYCRKNGLGYCKVVGELIEEIKQ